MTNYYIAISIFCLTLGGYLAIKIKRWINIRAMKKRFKAGATAERNAVPLLKRNGFKITDDQPGRNCFFEVDGEKIKYNVRADYLAERKGKKYVVEVKSGEKAPDPNFSDTRRQLLEYDHVYRPDGLILADMKNVVLKTIEFNIDRPSYTWLDKLKAAALFLAIGIAIGIVLAH